MAAFWDIVGKAANLLQLFGGLLDVITLITSFLRFRETRKECSKLEERVRMLRVLHLSPAGRWIMQQQQSVELLEGLVVMANALEDAHGLVESYKGSTLLERVRSGRDMARQFRDLRSTIDCYCGLILSFNAFLLAVQANQLPLPPSHVRSYRLSR
nr:unnamed protein product [Digitaria exilis]